MVPPTSHHICFLQEMSIEYRHSLCPSQSGPAPETIPPGEQEMGH